MSLRPPQWAADVYRELWKEKRPPFSTTNNVEHLLPHFKIGQLTDRTPPIIMVREEYHLIWDAMRSPSPSRTGGLVVWGQPGIGKSMFLWYALSRALHEQLPVAFCMQPGYFLWFDGTGVYRKHYDEIYPDELPKGTIALFDLTPDLEMLKFPFIDDQSEAYVVQATSPKPSHWRGWTKHKEAQIWPMKPWERAEVEKLCNFMDKSKLMDPSYYTPLELFDILGPSVRMYFHMIPKGLERLHFGGRDVVKDLPKLLESYLIQDDGSSFLLFFHAFVTGQHPMPWWANQSSFCQYHIPTRYLRDRALAPLRMQTPEDQNRLLSMFAPMPKIAGLLCEALAVDRIAAAAGGGTCKFANVPEFKLPAAKPTLLPEKLPDSPEDDMLYTMPGDFPTIDALAVTAEGTRATMLQMSIAKRHSIAASDIRKIVDLLGDRAADIDLNFVFVVPSDDIGRNLAEARSVNHCLKIRRPQSPAGKTTTHRSQSDLLEIPVGWLVVPLQGNEEILPNILKAWDENPEMEQDRLDED